MLGGPNRAFGGDPRLRLVRAHRQTSSMTTMDSDPIPTEPTTDPEPPVATPVVPGPSLDSGSPAAGRGRGSKLRRAAIGLALVVTFSVGIGVGRLDLPVLGGTGSTTPAPGASASTDFGLIREAWDTLHTKYVGADTLDDRALIYGAINGMTQAVGDTGHTSFMTPEQRAQRSTDLSGKYVGIGVRIDTADDGLPLVVGVFKGSPAEGAGLASGDEIVAVDGKPTTGHTIDEIVGWVRGEAGSSVTVTVRPGATGAKRDVSMIRADVAVAPVSWAIVPGTHTALLRLDQFSQGAADSLKAAIGDIKAAGADRLVLDLRGNPGGYVNEADAVASQFLKSGIVFIERDAQGNETRHEVASGGVATDLPLVVLVDGGTASSSEIVSGALQDAGRAQIVGVKTFGTGTVLGEFPLSDGSALRVGTVEWLTPDGRRIWHEGITPDVVVERPSDIAPLDPEQVGKMTPAQIAALTDPQLARALTLVTAVTTTGG
jgi:carboxyl-terminal processing protease